MGAPLRALYPEKTTLYQWVQEHLESFLAQAEGESGAGLSEFVKAVFDLDHRQERGLPTNRDQAP